MSGDYVYMIALYKYRTEKKKMLSHWIVCLTWRMY